MHTCLLQSLRSASSGLATSATFPPCSGRIWPKDLSSFTLTVAILVMQLVRTLVEDTGPTTENTFLHCQWSPPVVAHNCTTWRTKNISVRIASLKSTYRGGNAPATPAAPSSAALAPPSAVLASAASSSRLVPLAAPPQSFQFILVQQRM